MGTGEKVSIALAVVSFVGLMILAFCWSEIRNSKSARNIMIFFAFAFAMVFSLCYMLARDPRVETERVTAQITRDHPDFRVTELSVSARTITYEAGGNTCSTRLIPRSGEFLVATQGAQCAPIPSTSSGVG